MITAFLERSAISVDQPTADQISLLTATLDQLSDQLSSADSTDPLITINNYK